MKLLSTIIYGKKLIKSDYAVKDLLNKLFADSNQDEIHIEAINYFKEVYTYLASPHL